MDSSLIDPFLLFRHRIIAHWTSSLVTFESDDIRRRDETASVRRAMRNEAKMTFKGIRIVIYLEEHTSGREFQHRWSNVTRSVFFFIVVEMVNWTDDNVPRHIFLHRGWTTVINQSAVVYTRSSSIADIIIRSYSCGNCFSRIARWCTVQCASIHVISYVAQNIYLRWHHCHPVFLTLIYSKDC